MPKTLKKSYFGGGSKPGETRICSLARIVPTTSVATFIKPSTSSQVAQSRLKKNEIRLTHLPEDIQIRFTQVFTPRLFEAFGIAVVWAQSTEVELVQLWSSVFPQEGALIFGTEKGQIVQKLIDDRLSQWRNRFGKRALDAITSLIFTQLPENTTEQHAAWCEWALSGEDEGSHPFYYAIYEEPDSEVEGSVLKVKGLFQSPFIAAILAMHLSWILAIPAEQRSKKKPIGALIHAIQAMSNPMSYSSNHISNHALKAKRAISWWKEGKGEKKAPDAPFNEYSKSDWGDYVDIREGQPICVNSTSDLLDVVSNLKEKQWEKIIAVAAAAATPSGKGKKKAGAPERSAAPQRVNIELRDDDSDLAEKE